MDIQAMNSVLAAGDIEQIGLFPHLDRLKLVPFIFSINFGLQELPLEPGILLIRGARQYGKSTWLEEKLYNTIKKYGAGTAYYLNGENIPSADDLEKAITTLIPIFTKDAKVKRIFIDEITAVLQWEIALKRMADRGDLENILVITTGSRATDLRRGSEKLPGRKGKLSRTTYLFTPISYREFHKVCGTVLGPKTFISYLLSGGSPIACSELASNLRLPEYVIELVRDWIDGEIARAGRSRTALLNILNVIFRLGGSPVGQAKLARESGLANNTVAQGYIDLLNDLACIVPAYSWDQHRKLLILRKPCKYHFSNLLAAVAYHSHRIRSPEDFLQLPEKVQSIWYEWLIAQELSRRAAIQGNNLLEPLSFWQNSAHEIDFVLSPNDFLEVKRGKSSPVEFAWFAHQFPRKHLLVINPSNFQTESVEGLNIEEFLLSSS